jgi:hypothetical protein
MVGRRLPQQPQAFRHRGGVRKGEAARQGQMRGRHPAGGQGRQHAPVIAIAPRESGEIAGDGEEG